MKATLLSQKIAPDYKGKTDVDEIEEYIEKHRIIVWDYAYYFMFGKAGGYSRGSTFSSQPACMKAMRRLIYR